MSRLHYFIGYPIPAGFAVLALWSLACFVRNRPPASMYWNLLAVVQVLLGVQIAVGLLLFLGGASPGGDIPWLHYAYGGLFPAFLLVMAHRFAGRHTTIAWVVFGLVSFVNFGLTLRALMTGLGSG